MPKQSFIQEYSKQYSLEEKVHQEFAERESKFQFEDWRENPEPNQMVYIIEFSIQKRGAWLGSPLFSDYYPDNVYLTKEDAEKGLRLIQDRLQSVMKIVHGKYDQLEIPFLEKIK